MDTKLLETTRYFENSIVERVKLSVVQRDLFITLWRDEVLGKAVAKEFGSELQMEGREPVIVSPFGKIHVQFVLTSQTPSFCHAAVFWHTDYLGQREDVYKVYLRSSEVLWSDGSARPFDWDGTEREANTVTMGQIVRRALAASAYKTTSRIAEI